MSRITAVLDACVLYPAPLRSFLMYLALTGLYRARWTASIHDEWMRNVRKNHRDIAPEKIDRIRNLMDSHIRDSLVVGYEGRIESLVLPDPDDRHVLAAAIHARADVIVTFNLADFPSDVLGGHGVEALHPDGFILNLFDQAPDLVCSAARAQRESLKNPPMTVEQYLSTLERQRLVETVASLRRLADRI